jgi:hypothetical protein
MMSKKTLALELPAVIEVDYELSFEANGEGQQGFSQTLKLKVTKLSLSLGTLDDGLCFELPLTDD